MKLLKNFLADFLQNKYVKIALYFYTVVFPLLLFVMLERLNPAASAGLFTWPPSRRVFMLAFGLLLLLAIAAYSIIGNVLGAYAAVSGGLLVLYIINYFRLAVTGGVFVPTDIFLARAAAEVADVGVIRPSLSLILGILLVILIHVPLYFVKIKIPFKWRIIALPLVVLFALFFLRGSFAANHVLPAANLIDGTVTDRYRDRGFLLGFYAELVSGRRVPQITNETTIFDPILPPPAQQAPINPNVIVIMSESFMDPNILENITFSQNPVSNFHRLAEEHISGNVVVPVFGGGTINTEFEFLLGTPHVFFGSRFYVPAETPQRYFTSEVLSAMPWLFRQNGYRTIGVHPFHGNFFNRNDLYPLIGFDYFYSLDHMPDAPVWGEFVSDAYFTDRIIEQILLAEQVNEPLFLFGISMQNHWEFEPMKYGTLDLAVMAESPYLSAYEIQRMNSFLQGIYDADKQLGRLVEFIESRNTPTILVFFGDHLPILGLHSDRIFESLGFVSHQEDFNWDLYDRANIFQTQYLVWANYEIPQDGWGTLSTFFLGARMLEASGIRLNRHFTYLLRGAGYFSGITNELYVGLDGAFDHGWMHRESPHVRDMEALWYAKMLGGDNFHRSLAEVID